MTIYSQHANRGKVQILATYRGPAGVVSSTVTSVDDPATAAPIVDALNRISACATVPVSEWDERDGRFRHCPVDHLAALTDRDARPGLVEGAHSLWYEQAMLLLRHALADLDTAVAAVPAPVKTAIGAELEAEARALQNELAGEPPEPRRVWRFHAPFVEPVPGLQDREKLNDLEHGLDQTQLEQAVADLRLLLDAYLRCADGGAQLIVEDFEISADPDDEDAYFLTVQAPIVSWERTGWNIELGRWVPDGDGAEGAPVLDCARSAPPALSEVVELLNRSNGQSAVLAGWAETAVGEALAGTAFVVTNRY